MIEKMVKLCIPDQFKDLSDWLDKNPDLFVGSKAGCSTHGSLVLVIRTSENPGVSLDALMCLHDMIVPLQNSILNGLPIGTR